LYEPEFLRHDKGVVADREGGVTKSLAHLGRMPELLMAGPPFRDRGIPFAFAQRVVQVHIGQADHPHRGRLDNRDRAAGGVDHNLAQSGAERDSRAPIPPLVKELAKDAKKNASGDLLEVEGQFLKGTDRQR